MVILLITVVMLALAYQILFCRGADKVALPVLTLFIGSIALGLILLIGGVAATHDVRTPDEPFALQAISTGTGTSGQFFLGSGGFGSSAKFYWYEKSSNGSYTLEEAWADEVTIVESTGEPEVVYHTFDRESYDWVVAPFHFSHHYYDTLTFYVPPGSVASNIDLSLPKG